MPLNCAQRLREMPIRDIRDVEADGAIWTRMHAAMVSRCLNGLPMRSSGRFSSSGGSNTAWVRECKLTSLTIQAGRAVDGDCDVLASMRRRFGRCALDRSTRRQTRAAAFPLATGVSGGVRA
jgi:hypothetical protein